LILRASLVASDHSPRLLLQQFLGARQLQSAQNFRGFAPLKRALGLLDLRLKQPLLNSVQWGSLLDQVALLEQHFLEVARDTRPNLNPANRLDPADVIACSRDRFAFRLRDSDWNGRRRLLLGNGWTTKSAGQENSAKRFAHLRISDDGPIAIAEYGVACNFPSSLGCIA
jgi:hypothetical protein